MSDINERISEILMEFGIVADEKDPLFAYSRINDAIAADSLEKQEKIIGKFEERLELLANRQHRDAEESAERILQNTLKTRRRTMEEDLRRSTGEAAQKIEKSVVAAMKGPMTIARAVCVANVIAALVALSAAIIAVYAR